MLIRQPQWRWWLAAPALVLALMFWCELHGLALGVGAIGFGISFPWALKICVGWIAAGALLLRFGMPVLDSPLARRRTWVARSTALVAILLITLCSEHLLMPPVEQLPHWLYERVPVHMTFGILMLGSWLWSQSRRSQEAVAAPASIPTPPLPAPTMLDVLTGTGRTQVRLDDVECLEADRNYINVHTGQRSYLLRQTLASFEKSLGSSDFLRIHRSTIVNRAKIRERRRGGVLVLNSGRTVRISRAFADRVH